ncbi:MAG: prolyl oligopeptidase family serine peptidase, partial [Bacteroidaceae bacterium]|nr:prolyl oligopeptidase family serine peptidase [Bacteroidaceae bacterium]
YPRIYQFKYPKAGEDNAKVSVYAYNLESQTVSKKALDINKEDYIPVIKTIPADCNKVMACIVNRHQDEMKLWKLDCKSDNKQLLVTLKSNCYLPEEAVTDLTLYPDGFVVLNDNEGKMQPFLYDYEGKLIRRLIADSSIIVTAFYGYDFRTKSSYFQAVGKTPMQRVVYKADKKGKLTQLSKEDGWNDAVFNYNFSKFLLSYSNINTPAKYTLVEGKKEKIVEDNAKLKDILAKETLPTREFFTFKTTEGVELNGLIYKPADFDASKKYPVILHQYSGPGSQQVTDNWTAGSVARGGMFEAILCQHGYICVVVDPRGTGARGADFQKLTYMKMGKQESRDQVEAALYMAKQPYVDASKIAIWGWSYGGFNTLMSMSEGSNVFCCGVAIAPPTDWRFYDTIYTERYMRTPQENPEGYGDNPSARAEKLHGDLLLCHGLCDDNVHPQNTFEYTSKLVEHGKQFDMHIFTNSNHSIYNGNSRRFLLEKVLNFFDSKLRKP